MEKNYEEFFYSEDPQEIEKEKKKRNVLHSLFPNLMGGKEDRTNYVLKENNKIKEPSANTKDPTFLESPQEIVHHGLKVHFG